jgi:transcription elongation factor Elf1
LELSCQKCGQRICSYQKDGSGLLKRLYFDRMLDYTNHSDKLVCSDCGQLLGIQIIYKKESRDAYRLIIGAVSKKTS